MSPADRLPPFVTMRTLPGPPSPMDNWQPPAALFTRHAAPPALKKALYPLVGTTPPLQLPLVVQRLSEGWAALPAGFQVVATCWAFAESTMQSKRPITSPPKTLHRFFITTCWTV